jgi:hypothetical protein
VHEPEPRRVQRHAAERVGSASVLAVAGDRMACRGELCSDLTTASRHQAELEQGRVAPPLENAIACDRLPTRPAVDRRPNAECPILSEPRGQ